MDLNLDNLPIITFEVAASSTVTKWADTLETVYNKDKLLKIVQSLRPLFDNHVVMLGRAPLAEEYSLLMRKKTQSSKNTISGFLAKLLALENNRSIIFATFPEDVRNVWYAMSDRYFLSADDIRKIMGRETPPTKMKWGYEVADADDLQDVVAWFGLLKSYWGISGYFYIPATILSCFTHLLHRAVTETRVRKLRANLSLSHFSAEGETIRLIPVLQNLYSNGIIDRGKSRVGVAMVKKVQKLTSAVEFFPDAELKEDRILRTTMLVNAYCFYASTLEGKRVMAPHETVKAIYSGLLNSSSSMASFLISVLFGKTTSTTNYGLNLSRLFKSIDKWLTSEAAEAGNDWLLADGFFSRLRNEPGNMQNFLLFMPENLIESSAYNLRTDITLRPNNQCHQAGYPIHLAVLMLLASLGLIELAYAPATDFDPSAMNGLYALRLTTLGRYALGLEKDYTTKENKDEVLFELDSERLIIRALGDNNPYEGILKDFALPIGAHRYVVTPDSFLSGCSSRRDIEDRINFFRQTVSRDYTPNWKEFFDRMLAGTGKLREPSVTFRTFSVDRSDPYLLEILTSDPQLRSLVRRAEDYIILVETGNLSKFTARMRHFGYLV